jgi:choline kinase
VRAVLLCAGRGRRLGVDEPKCLINIAGKSLLERHLDHLARAGVSTVHIVMGHMHQKLEAALAVITDMKRATGQKLPDVDLVMNERFERGSLVSLQCAVANLEDGGGLWMDADVFYPGALIKRLVRSSHENCVLLDGKSSEQGEEMMLAARGDRITRIARRVGPDWDLVGESVGFFKIGAEGAVVLRRVLDAEVEAGRLDQEHEDALNIALAEVSFGYERVDDLPWTEIDFPDDVVKAEGLARDVEHPERQ